MMLAYQHYCRGFTDRTRGTTKTDRHRQTEAGVVLRICFEEGQRLITDLIPPEIGNLRGKLLNFILD